MMTFRIPVGYARVAYRLNLTFYIELGGTDSAQNGPMGLAIGIGQLVPESLCEG